MEYIETVFANVKSHLTLANQFDPIHYTKLLLMKAER